MNPYRRTYASTAETRAGADVESRPDARLDGLLRAFAAYLRAERLSENTVVSYLADLRRFFGWLEANGRGLDDLAVLTRRDLRRWMALAVEPGRGDKSSASQARALSSLKKLAYFCGISDGYRHLRLDWLTDVKPPKAAHRQPRAMPADRLGRLLGAGDPGDWRQLRDSTVFLLMYATGLRLAEALGLSRRLLFEDVITVTGKGDKQRRVPLLPIVRESYERYLARCPFDLGEDGPAFVSARGRRLGARAVQRRLEKLRRELNLDPDSTPHAFRRAFASHLLADGANLRVIQELLGHSSLATTQRYTAIDESRLVDQLRALHPRN